MYSSESLHEWIRQAIWFREMMYCYDGFQMLLSVLVPKKVAPVGSYYKLLSSRSCTVVVMSPQEAHKLMKKLFPMFLFSSFFFFFPSPRQLLVKMQWCNTASCRIASLHLRAAAGNCVMLAMVLTHLFVFSLVLLRSLLHWPRSWTPAGSSCWRRRRRSLSSKPRGTTPGYLKLQHTTSKHLLSSTV